MKTYQVEVFFKVEAETADAAWEEINAALMAAGLGTIFEMLEDAALEVTP